jgi:hypothetical protein
VKKPRTDAVREDRIHEEAIVDAYGPEEQALGWYYYLENKIRFPFAAKCIAANSLSPLRKGETVSVLGSALGAGASLRSRHARESRLARPQLGNSFIATDAR